MSKVVRPGCRCNLGGCIHSMSVHYAGCVHLLSVNEINSFVRVVFSTQLKHWNLFPKSTDRKDRGGTIEVAPRSSLETLVPRHIRLVSSSLKGCLPGQRPATAARNAKRMLTTLKERLISMQIDANRCKCAFKRKKNRLSRIQKC